MGICLEVSFDPGVTGATSIDRGRERNDVFKRMAEVCPCLCLCLYLRNTLATRHSLALTPRRLHVSLSPPLGIGCYRSTIPSWLLVANAIEPHGCQVSTIRFEVECMNDPR
jgi:hypothetical protein